MSGARDQGSEAEIPPGDVLLSPASPVIAPPARLRDDAGLQQIGWLILALVFSTAFFLTRLPNTIIIAIGCGAVLGVWYVAATAKVKSWALAGGCLIAYTLLVLGFINIAWAGAALAPLSVLLLAMLLPRHNTALAGANWGYALVLMLWGAVGVFGLLALLTIPTPLGPAVVPVLGALIAYNAGRRAGQRQGLSERVATGIGLTLAVAGAVALGPTGAANLALVLGLVLGLLAVQLAPAPPVARETAVTALLVAHGQIVFVAPLTFALLWLVRTVAP